MRSLPVFYFLILIFLFACNQSPKKHSPAIYSKTDSIKADTLNKISWRDEVIKSIPKDISPVFGYRFIVEGDFDGDGKSEKLTEHFFSGTENKETNKFYEGLNFDQLVVLTEDKAPFSFVTCNNKNIDTLLIFAEGQLLGLSYMKNEGDLNGDGSDEISYVVNWADWSSLNTCHIVTWDKKKWKKIYSFPIWDWQVPDLPQTFNQYGLMGLEDKLINTKNDTVNQRLEKELNNFSGFIKKIKTNKIQVRFRNNEAMEDTIIVDL